MDQWHGDEPEQEADEKYLYEQRWESHAEDYKDED